MERFLDARLEWIRQAQARFAARAPVAPFEFVTGERHHFRGKQVELLVRPHDGTPSVSLVGEDILELRANPALTSAQRRAAVERWYRDQLTALVPAVVEPWAARMNVVPVEWRIRRMRTRWGTCNTRDRRIWLNLHLAAVSAESLEYIIVHELVHLLEPSHNSRFRSLMDHFLPDWRRRRSILNSEGRERRFQA